MIRYKLIDRNEGLKQIDDYHKNMNESIEDILNILENLNLDDLKKEFITFYLESPYFEKTTQSNITWPLIHQFVNKPKKYNNLS